MRPSSSPFTHPSGLVDKRLGNMWAQIEEVRTYLPQIAHVSYYLESLFNLDRNLTLLSDENVDHHILKDITIFQGANAYEIALDEGYVGDVTSWLASLVGPKGDTGLLDEVAHQALIDGIAANAAAASAAQAAADANAAALGNYVLQTTYDTRVAAVDTILDGLEATILGVVTPLIPTVRTNTEINNLAQAAIDASLVAVNSAISTVDGRVDAANLNIADLQSGLADTDLAFGSFLLAYDGTLTRLDTLEASSGDYSAAITNLQSVTAASASAITLLQANDTTFASEILALQTVTGDSATQINALQVANNANNISITEMELAYIAADEAVAQTVENLSVRTDLALLGSANILPNWDLRAVDGDGKPLGIRGVESANAAARTAYLSAIAGGGMRIDGSVDTQQAYGFPAVPIDEKITYKVIVKHKSSAAAASGLYIRMNERATALDPGTTHIGQATGEAEVSVRSSYVDLVTNGAMPGTTLVTSEYDYTPTPGTWLASPSFYNWTGFSGDYEVISVQLIPRSNVIYDYVDAEITAEALIRSTADGTQVTSINNLSLDLGTLSGTVSTQGGLIADLQGNLTATYGIVVDGGGNGSFISLEDGVSVPSTIILGADEIVLDGDVFVTGSVSGPDMFAANALTVGGADEVAGSVTINSSSWTTLATKAITVPANASFVMLHFSTQVLSLGTYNHTSLSTLEYSITRNGTEIYNQVAAVNPGPVTAVTSSGGTASIGSDDIIIPQHLNGPVPAMDVDFTPAEGTNTYVFRARRAAVTGEPTRASFTLSDRKLVVDVRKR